VRKVPVDSLRPGMKVGRSIYDSCGRLLVAAGAVLSRGYIRRLKAYGVPAVYIDDGLLPDVCVEDVTSDDVRVQAMKQVRLLLEEETQGAPVGRALIRVQEMAQTVNEIIDQLLSRESVVVNLTDIRSLDDYTFGHSVNVCVLSLITGITLGYGREELFRLGMGAVLHDIGKVRVPEEILNKPGSLTGEEFEVVKQHTVYGYELLRSLPDVGHASAYVALQHHERHDGQGYPEGLRGDEIHPFARIVAVADVFDALTSDRVYRRALPVHEAWEMLAGSGDYFFEFRIVRAFLFNVAAYPVGTIVALSSGEVGVVVETARGLSRHPRVRVLFDAGGAPVTDGREWHLAKERGVTVVRVVGEEELENPEIKKEAEN